MTSINEMVPWLEEVIMILITACVFIATHFSFYSNRKQDTDKKKWIASPPASTEDRAQHRIVRESRGAPITSIDIPGVTDTRFNGVIIAYRQEEGYGFIQCPVLHERFHRDVFLHKAQVGDFAIGAKISFGVFLSKAGHPQAKKLAAWEPTEAELAAAMQTSQPRPAVEKAPLNPDAKPFTMGAYAEAVAEFLQDVPTNSTYMPEAASQWWAPGTWEPSRSYQEAPATWTSCEIPRTKGAEEKPWKDQERNDRQYWQAPYKRQWSSTPRWTVKDSKAEVGPPKKQVWRPVVQTDA